MLDRVLKRLTYANVASTIALVLAMSTGGAYAADHLLTGADIKNGSLTGADIKTHSLGGVDLKKGTIPKSIRGQTGLQGPKGDAGPQGPKGAAGTQGEPGTSALGPLPSGHTLTGGGILSEGATASGQTVRNYENFPVHLAQPISEISPRDMFFGTNNNVPSSIYAAGEQDSRCSGTPAAPTAPAGLLCVYAYETGGVSDVSVRAGVLGIGDDVANDAGFYVFGTSSAAGDTFIRYTWAYTAP